MSPEDQKLVALARSARANMRLVVGPSTVTGFSMKVCRPLSMA